MTDEIIILYSEENEKGTGVYVQGEILAYPGWSFRADVLHEPDPSSDCMVCDLGRVASVTLEHKGEHFYTWPGDCYDGRNVYISADNYRMCELINQHFPPTPEQVAALAAREALIKRIADRLDELRRTEFADVAADVFRLALRKAETRLSSL
jgi:hypothetical protein